jgi:2-phospho-L-lactate guanylyltransferase
MNCWALLALKPLDRGKSRLAAVLSPAQRGALIRTMLDLVIHAMERSRQIAGIAMVTREVGTLPPAALVLPDRGLGLNQAVADSARTLVGLGARELLVLHPDLPLLRPGEIDAFIARGRDTGFAIAPDRHGMGTNALFLSPPNPFDFCFGRRSFERHLRAARKRGLDSTIVWLPGFALDIDEPADLAALRDYDGDLFASADRSWSSSKWTTSRNDCWRLPVTGRG